MMLQLSAAEYRFIFCLLGLFKKIDAKCLIVKAKMSMTMQARYSITRRVVIYFAIDLSEVDYEDTKERECIDP